MNILIAGGTGFIGKVIVDAFAKEGNQVYVLTRRQRPDAKNITFIQWLSGPRPDNQLKHQPLDAFINLAGDPINKGRWTERKKEAILESRIRTTREAINIVDELEQKPKVYMLSVITAMPASGRLPKHRLHLGTVFQAVYANVGKTRRRRWPNGMCER